MLFYYCFFVIKYTCFFSSPIIRMLCTMASRILSWNWTRLSPMAETPSWSPMTVPVTPAAPRVPCALYHELWHANGAQTPVDAIASKSYLLLFLKRFFLCLTQALNVRPHKNAVILSFWPLMLEVKKSSCVDANTISNDVICVWTSLYCFKFPVASKTLTV